MTWKPHDPYKEYGHLEPEEFMAKIIVSIPKDEHEDMKAKIERLESRGIHDMQHRIAELEGLWAENVDEDAIERKGYEKALDKVLALPRYELEHTPYMGDTMERNDDGDWIDREHVKNLLTTEGKGG